jgi:hypothetical protein
MNRTALRVVTAAAALVLGLTAPGTIGIAAADDRPTDARTSGLSSELQQNTELVAALQSAREDYRASVLSTRSDFRTVLQGLQDDITQATASQRSAARVAGDAYRAVLEGRATGDLAALKAEFASAWNAYRDALTTARVAARSAMDTAAGSAKASLMTARSIYTKAVNDAFAEHAPRTSVPRVIQDPSGWMGMADSRWLVQGMDVERSS